MESISAVAVREFKTIEGRDMRVIVKEDEEGWKRLSVGRGKGVWMLVRTCLGVHSHRGMERKRADPHGEKPEIRKTAAE